MLSRTHTKLVLLFVLFSVNLHSARAWGYWTWVTGSTESNPPPVVDVPGVPNSPGATTSSVMWIHEDTLYVLAGANRQRILNTPNGLWKYNITAKTWIRENWQNEEGEFGTRVRFKFIVSVF
jgi:hypothetical protein